MKEKKRGRRGGEKSADRRTLRETLGRVLRKIDPQGKSQFSDGIHMRSNKTREKKKDRKGGGSRPVHTSKKAGKKQRPLQRGGMEKIWTDVLVPGEGKRKRHIKGGKLTA